MREDAGRGGVDVHPPGADALCVGGVAVHQLAKVSRANAGFEFALGLVFLCNSERGIHELDERDDRLAELPFGFEESDRLFRQPGRGGIQWGGVDVEAWLVIAVYVPIPGVQGKKSVQSVAECSVLVVGWEQGVGVVLVDVEFVVPVGILTVKVAGAHTLRHQKLVEKTDRAIGD